MAKRGRPTGSIKNKVPTAVINEWASVWNEGGDTGKAFVIQRIESLGLEKDVVLERMAEAYDKKRSPELVKVIDAEIDKLMANLIRVVSEDDTLKRLSKLSPRYNIVINLADLSVQKVKRPVPRAKNVREAS